MIKSEQDLLAMLQAETREVAKRHLYKYTDCGAWISFDEDSVLIGSIVEGCCFGTATYRLTYPFSDQDWDRRITAIEEEADELWKWANEGTGQDPPPEISYLHLDPEGRSA